MQLRDFGQRNGFKVPRASIGGMRLPSDEGDAIALIRHAIDSGMRYIDTSRGYGDSETKIGKALKDGYREKVILSTKWSPWIQKVEPTDEPTAECEYKRIVESLNRLDVEYLDYYQLWNIQNRDEFDQMTASGGMLDGIRRAIDEGLVRRTGFTAHDTPENLLDYIQIADWADIMLVTYNMLDRTYEPVLRAAHEKGIGTIVMNPVAGGRLAEHSQVFETLVHDTGSRSLADLAIRWIMANPNVDTVISGIAKPSDVDDTVMSVNAKPLTHEQANAVNVFIEAHTPKNLGFCTACGYCMPCPEKIDIPTVMNAIYQHRYLGLTESAKNRYGRIKGPNASACVACAECMEKCTQRLNIIEQMALAREMFE